VVCSVICELDFSNAWTLVHVGELVVLTRRVDDNWFEGRIGNTKGIFPVSYVEVLSEPGEKPGT
jgi:hypothetical protein